MSYVGPGMEAEHAAACFCHGQAGWTGRSPPCNFLSPAALSCSGHSTYCNSNVDRQAL